MPITRNSSKKDWVEYMREAHGLNMDADTKDVIIAKASELEGLDYGTVTASEVASVSAAHADLRRQDKVKLLIPSNETNEGKQDVFVGVNGVMYQIQRDQPVEVPTSVYHVLNDAKAKLYAVSDDGEMIERQVHRYPFSIVA